MLVSNLRAYYEIINSLMLALNPSSKNDLELKKIDESEEFFNNFVNINMF